MHPGNETPPHAEVETPQPRAAPNRARLWSALRRAGAGAALLIAGVALALNRPLARNTLLIFLLAVGLAYVVAPLAGRLPWPRRLVRTPLKPVWKVLILYGILMLPGAAAWMAAAGPMQRQLRDLREQSPLYFERARQRLEMIEKVADRFPSPEPYAAHVRSLAQAVSESIRLQAANVYAEVKASRSLLPWLWLAPAASLLLINGVAPFRESTVAHLPEGHLRWRGEEFFQHVNFVLAGYTRAQLWSAVIVGLASIAGFWLIGLPYALLLGAISGLCEFLPIAGPLSAAIVACTLVTGERLFVLLAFLIALRLAQDYLVYPRLLGRGMHLHPLAIMATIFAGAQMGGMLGVLVAVPLVGITSVAVRHWREYWDLEKLLREHARKQDLAPAVEGLDEPGL